VITCNTSKLPVTWWSPYSIETRQQIEKITFNTPSLIELPSNLLKQFPNVKMLDAQNMQLTSGITKFEADDSNQLAVLLLSSNKLAQLGEISFSELNRVKYLDLSNNTLNNFTCESFVGLYDLNTLDLSYNQINSVTCNFLILPKLKTLKLNDNLINSISLENQKFSSLQHLFLQTNSFDDGTSFLSSLKHLVVLNLSNNTNMNVWSSFNNTELTCLYLDNVRLPLYGIQLFTSLENLELLSIRDNSITKLDLANFTALRNLKVFDFSHNNLSKIEYMTLNQTFPKLKQVYPGDNPWEEYDLRAMKEYFKMHKIEFDAISSRVGCNINAVFTQGTPTSAKILTMHVLLIGSNIIFIVIIVMLSIILIFRKKEKPTKLMVSKQLEAVAKDTVKMEKSLYEMPDYRNNMYCGGEPKCEQAPIEEMEADEVVYMEMSEYGR
jgi:hypothetical protein